MGKTSLKKLAIAMTATATFYCAHANSDILGVYVGAGVWQASTSGDLSNVESVSIDELGFDDAQNTFAYIAFEHPVPVLPNVRVSLSNISTEGSSTIDREITLINDEFTIPLGASTESELDLSHIDYTLYYEVLDNYVSADIGLTGRAFGGEASISYSAGDADSDTEQVDLDEIIPMLYAKLQLDLPFTGWYAGGSGNFISIQDNSISDFEAKVGYMTSGLGLDVGFDIGYRSFSIAVEPDADDLEADLTIDGPYASLLVHF